jgi:hypothetical protein
LPAYDAGATETHSFVCAQGIVTPARNVTRGDTDKVCDGPLVAPARVAVTAPPAAGTKVALKAPPVSVTGLATVTPLTATVTVSPAVAGVTVPLAVTD